MAVPRFMAHINKRVFNPRERRRGKRPVLTHVGRNSGVEFQTPMDAFPVDGGFLFIGLYGPKTDWIRNVISAGSASVRYQGDHIALEQPRLVSQDEAESMLAASGHSPRTPSDGRYLVMTTT